LVLKNSIGIGTLHCGDRIIHPPGSLLKGAHRIIGEAIPIAVTPRRLPALPVTSNW